MGQQGAAPKSGRVNIEERRRQRAAAQRNAASRIGEGLAGLYCIHGYILNIGALVFSH